MWFWKLGCVKSGAGLGLGCRRGILFSVCMGVIVGVSRVEAGGESEAGSRLGLKRKYAMFLLLLLLCC